MHRLVFDRVVIDGVPAYVGNQSGHVVAGLTFRVGIADESALDRGLTALLAELAAIDVADVEFAVGMTFTSFVARGRTPAIAEALTAVCRALFAFGDEDLIQLADTILDEPARLPTLEDTLLGLRFGAQNYGTGALPPLGLLRVDGEHARAWAARFFTRRNAALWSTGPLAPTASLPLPAGTRVEPPERTEAECEVPAWCPNAWLGSMFRDAVDCSIVADGSDATNVALNALTAELYERLDETRLRGAEPKLDIDTWSEQLSHIALTLPTAAHGNIGIEYVLGTLDDFADLGPDPDELADAISDIETWAVDGDNAALIAEMLANDELRTGRSRTLDGFLTDINAVTAAEVATVFGGMRDEIILAAPSDGEIIDPRFTLLERADGFALDGKSYKRARVTGMPDDDARLIVGPDGVTYARADEMLTVCYEDCVAAVWFPDGTISLFDIDGTTIDLAEEDWREGDKAFATMKESTPPEVTLAARRVLGAPPAPGAVVGDTDDDDTDDDAIDFDEDFEA